MIVIPMAGLSSRFKKSGYQLPKYMLKAHGKTLFSHSVGSFKSFFNKEEFIFIALDSFDTKRFIENQCSEMGIKNYRIVILDRPTKGQAETVYLGIKQAMISEDEDLLIFNIDTFRPGFSLPIEFNIEKVDAYLETFVGSGSNWSNVLPADELLQTVKLTAEKQEISQYCCTGLYYWRYCSDFCKIFEVYQNKPLDQVQAGEYYIAPMYNELISQGKDVRYSVIESSQVIFCGVPDEYNTFKKENY